MTTKSRHLLAQSMFLKQYKIEVVTVFLENLRNVLKSSSLNQREEIEVITCSG